MAVYAQDAKLTIGHSSTNSTTINGNLELGNNDVTIYGNKIAINGLRGKEEWDNPAAIKTTIPVHMSIGQAGTDQTNIVGYLDFMPMVDYKNLQGNEIAIAGQNVILDNAGYDVMYAGNSKDVRIGSDFDGNTSENTVLKGTVKVSGLVKDGQFGIHGKISFCPTGHRNRIMLPGILKKM